MDNEEINRALAYILAYFSLALGIIILCAVMVKGVYFHLWTALACFGLFFGFRPEKRGENDPVSHDDKQ